MKAGDVAKPDLLQMLIRRRQTLVDFFDARKFETPGQVDELVEEFTVKEDALRVLKEMLTPQPQTEIGEETKKEKAPLDFGSTFVTTGVELEGLDIDEPGGPLLSDTTPLQVVEEEDEGNVENAGKNSEHGSDDKSPRNTRRQRKRANQ